MICKEIIDSQRDKVYFQHMGNRVILFASLIICLFSFASASENPLILNVEFPSLDGEIRLAAGDTVLYTPYPLQFDVEFYLSSEGKVDSFSCFPVKKKMYLDKIGKTLRGLQFFPARIDGISRPFILAGEIIFRPVFNRPEFLVRFPFDEPNCELINHLVEKSLLLNGFSLPEIVRFPSYYCPRPVPTVNETDYPFVIFEIELDSAGTLIDYDQIFTNRSDCAHLLSNVLLHSEFSPPLYHGRPFGARLNIAVRLFSQVSYPTVLWSTGSAKTGRNIFEMTRVEALLYLGSVVNPPYPINAPAGDYTYGSLVPFRDSVDILVHIDSLGKVSSAKYQFYTPDRLRRVIDDILKKLKFTPAVNREGESIGFDGALRFGFNNSKNIRIQPNWLPFAAGKANK